MDDAAAKPAVARALSVELPAVAESVATARRQVVFFAARHGARAERQHDIALAVSEAVTNAIVHGYRDDAEPGRVQLVADVIDGGLEILITDDGHGVRADAPSEGLGLGLSIIARLVARFTVTPRSPRGTEIWMRFNL